MDITGLLMILLAFARINLRQGHAPERSHQVCTHDTSLFIDLFLNILFLLFPVFK